MTNVSVPYVMEVPYRILIMPFFQLQILSSCKSNDLITWENARADVKKVQLEFRDNKHAQIADLKIDYCNN